MIEEFIRALARINELQKQGFQREAAVSIEEQAKRLTGTDIATLATLSETELFARLMRGGEVHYIETKTLMLARVLLDAAETLEDPPLASRLRLNALHLLLKTALRSEGVEWPEFVPRIDILAERLGTSMLPVETHVLLMQHYERSGQFAKAEDSLFAALDLLPGSPALLQIGLAFYQRLLAKSDADLEEGELPRAEVESGRADFRAKFTGVE